MKNDVRLFIGNKEIEFNADPKILFNYKVTDVTNPSAVKNSFTKSIEIDSTPNNDAVFENIWNLERVQWAGVDFNPLKKADFKLFVNGDLYERGYAKLDGIKTANNKTTYSITLFGGLGSFFYNLSFKDSDGANKKMLRDLKFNERSYNGDGYGDYAVTDPDLNFRINKDSLWDAWMQITGDPDAVYDASEVNRPNNYLWDDKWEVINFAPAYNGVPDDFDVSRCIINKNNMPALTFSKEDNGVTYTDYLGYAMGEQENDELTEWMTFDLRSYLQRPVVNFKRVIDAAANPVNNGGYEVVLDSSWFSTRNPYYWSAWMTLPMLRENIEGGETETSTEGAVVYLSGSQDGEYIETKHYDVEFETDTISKIVNVKLDLFLDLFVAQNLTNEYMYIYQDFKATPTYNSDIKRVGRLESVGSVSVQLVAYDALRNVVGSSNVYFIIDPKAVGATLSEDTLWYENGIPVPGVTTVYGKFKKLENLTAGVKYRLVNDEDNDIVLNFNFASEVTYTTLELKVLPMTTDYIDFYRPYKWWRGQDYNGIHRMVTRRELRLFKYNSLTYGGNISVDNALALNNYEVDESFDILSFELISKDYSSLFSNTYISKDVLLNTEESVADFLIGYAKMFGLHFYYDPAEQARDPQTAPNGVIHIMTRDTYYTGETVDLSEFIDLNKGLNMKPVTMDSKWINFNVPQIDSEAEKEYLSKYGIEYGYKKIDTGYDFNADNKAIISKVPFKGAIDVLETSKYYQQQIDGYPAYGFNGFKYFLFNNNDGDLSELEITDLAGPIYKNSINPNDWLDTDVFKKPQFHEKDNGSIDAKNVLLFYTGLDFYNENLNFNYWLTDDIEEMVTLNDSTPCWIMTVDEFDTSGKRIAYKQKVLPLFERNIVYTPTGTILHNWDFGGTQTTFVRDMFNGTQSSIYYKCWEKYISDLYDQNNRILTANVVFKDRPSAEMLRKFYWFNNTLWRMNTIKDYNVAGYDSTVVEFIKVIDPENYTLNEIKMTSDVTFYFTGSNVVEVTDDYPSAERTRWFMIDWETQKVDAVIETGNAGSWCFGDGRGGSYGVQYEGGEWVYGAYEDLVGQQECGSGNALVEFNIPQNDPYYGQAQERTFNFSIVTDDDTNYYVKLIQGAKPEQSITITPSSITGPAEGGTMTATVYYKNRMGDSVTYDYNESEEYDYFDFSLSSWNGDYATLTITFNENNTNVEKTGAYLRIQGVNSGASASITINQEAGRDESFTPDFDLSISTVNAEAEGASYTVTLLNNTTDSYTVNTPIWVTKRNVEDSSFEIVVQENTEGTRRIGIVQVTGKTAGYDDVVKIITVMQEANVIVTPSFELTPSIISVGAVATSQTVTLIDNTMDSYTVSTPTWISTRNIENTSFELVIEENTGAARTGAVQVTGTTEGYDDVVRTITVNQAATTNEGDTPDFDLSPNTVNVGAAASSQTITLVNNTTDSYTVDDSVLWVYVSSSDSESFVLSFLENNTGAERTTTVQVTGTTEGYDDVVKTITVTQNYYSGSIALDTSVITVGGEIGDVSETYTLTLNNITEVEYNITPSDRFEYNISEGQDLTVRALLVNDTGAEIVGSFFVKVIDTRGNTFIKRFPIRQTPS